MCWGDDIRESALYVLTGASSTAFRSMWRGLDVVGSHFWPMTFPWIKLIMLLAMGCKKTQMNSSALSLIKWFLSDATTTLIQHIFFGRYKSEVKCDKCGAVLNEYNKFMELILQFVIHLRGVAWPSSWPHRRLMGAIVKYVEIRSRHRAASQCIVHLLFLL